MISKGDVGLPGFENLYVFLWLTFFQNKAPLALPSIYLEVTLEIFWGENIPLKFLE